MSKFFLLFLSITLFASICLAQSKTKDIEAGNTFHISIPDYMTRTVSLNSAAIFQFKNSVKDVYGFVIEDDKEELKIAEMTYSSASEFLEETVKDFAKDGENRVVSKFKTKEMGDNHISQCEITCHFAEDSTDIYYFIGVVETPVNFYKLICWTQQDNQDKYRADFERILFSIKE